MTTCRTVLLGRRHGFALVRRLASGGNFSAFGANSHRGWASFRAVLFASSTAADGTISPRTGCRRECVDLILRRCWRSKRHGAFHIEQRGCQRHSSRRSDVSLGWVRLTSVPRPLIREPDAASEGLTVDAMHCCSYTTLPCATEPEPAGSPRPSGNDEKKPVSSEGGAVTPNPNSGGAAFADNTVQDTSTDATSTAVCLVVVNIRDLSISCDVPALNRVTVVVGAQARSFRHRNKLARVAERNVSSTQRSAISPPCRPIARADGISCDR